MAGLAHGWCFLAPIPFLSNACNSCGGTPTHGPTALGQLHMRCISLANAWPTNECVGCLCMGLQTGCAAQAPFAQAPCAPCIMVAFGWGGEALDPFIHIIIWTN